MQLAQELRAAGVPVFPCWARWDQSKGKYAKGPAVPKGESWFDVSRWPMDDPRLNWDSDVVGVPIPDNVVVFDVDEYKGATREAIEAALGCALPWDAALVQRTISGGAHYAFYAPDWPVRQGDDVAGVHGFDTRVAGRGFICSGEGYTPSGAGVLAFALPFMLPKIPDALRPILERVTVTTERAELGHTQEDEAQLFEALGHIDPGCERSKWVRLGMALRDFYRDDPERGRTVFAEWSAGTYWPGTAPDNYVAEHIDHQWDSFKPDGATTVATLFYEAIQHGWQPPRAVLDLAAVFAGSAGQTAGEWFDALVERIRTTAGDVKNIPAIVADISQSGAPALYVALLVAEIKSALRDAGIKDPAIGKSIDSLFEVKAPRALQGDRLAAGAVLDPSRPIHPDEWAPMHTKGKDMKPKGTLENFRVMLRAYGIAIQFDEVRKSLQISGPTVPGDGVLKEEAALAYIDSLANLNDYPTAAARTMIMSVAHECTFNPVREYVHSTVWDGRDHVGHLIGQIQFDPAEDEAFCAQLIRRWLRGAYAIGAGYLDCWEYVVVLIDPSGGAGKTRFFRTLAPKGLRADSVILDTANKDSVKVATSYWLTELGELDGTFSRTESSRIKAFLSQSNDEMRMPYGRAYLNYPRRTAFFASVNETHFLLDQSDNRRFWGIRVARTNHQHNVDMQQVWAQAAAEYHAGYGAHLTPQEDQVLRARNEAFRTSSPIADALSSLTLTADNGSHLTASELLAMAGITRPSRADLNEVARLLPRLGFPEVKRGTRRGFNVTARMALPPAFMPAVVK